MADIRGKEDGGEVAPGAALPSLQSYVSAVHSRWLAEESEQPWREFEASLLFADVSGFTALSERLAKRGREGSEELTAIVNHVFEGLLEVCDAFGGDVLKFGGDALLVMFPRAGHERRAAAAGAAMQRAIRSLAPAQTEAGSVKLRMSVGIASGPVSLFLTGSLHREMVVVGPTTTAVAELEGAATAGQVLVSPATAAELPRRHVAPGTEGGQLLRGAPTAAIVGPLLRRTGEDARPGLPGYMRDHTDTEGEHRTIAVAFVQAKGIGALLASGTFDAAYAAVDDVVSRTQQACRDHGVSFFATDVDKDALKLILAAGAPTSSPDDADRLLHAVRDIVSVPTALSVRAGVNRGQAFVVDVGSETRRTYTVMGDTVNIAARVMGKAEAGQVLATSELLDRVRTPFEREALEPFAVKGKKTLVTAEIIGEPQSGAGPARKFHEAPLVGREDELTALRGVVDSARSGRGSTVMLIGDPGIGKSRLVAAFVEYAEDMAVFSVDASPYATASPYHAVQGSLRNLIGVTNLHADDEVAKALADTVARVDPELTEWLPLLAIPLGLELPPTPTTAALSAEFSRARLHTLVTRLISKLLPVEKSVIVVEDAHWLDEASSQLIGFFVERAKGWGACITRRDTPGGLTLADSPGVCRINLGPLGEAAAELLIRGTDDDEDSVRLYPAQREMLLARSNGNPLFLRELVAAVRAGDDIESLPDTVEALLTARIDTLARPDRAFIRIASVLGQRFRTSLLTELSGEDEDVVARRLAAIGEFVVEDGPERLRFRHALIRDVSYAGLSFRRKRLLHARAGVLIEQLAGDSTDQVAELLSLHFHAANRWEDAWKWSRAAGDQAARRGAPADAVLLYRRALDAGERVDDIPASERSAVAEALGDCCDLGGHYDPAAEAFKLARRFSADDALRVAQLCLKEGWVRQHARSYTQALSWYTRGRRSVEAAGAKGPDADSVRVRLDVGAGLARLRQGRYRDAIALLEPAVQEAKRLEDLATVAHGYYLLDWAYTDLGNPQDEYRDGALPIYEQLGDMLGQANVLNNLGINALYEGRWDEAIDCFERSREARSKTGDILQMATTSLNMAEVLIRQGYLLEGERIVREALDTCRATSNHLAIGVALTNLGNTLSLQGRFVESAKALAEARETLEGVGADRMVLEVDGVEAERRVLSGDSAGAMKLTADALARAEKIGGVHNIVSGLTRVRGLARVDLGHHKAARTDFATALVIAREGQARYEEALALCALAGFTEMTGGDGEDHRREASPLLASLGVVGALPLPMRGRRAGAKRR